MPEGIHLSTTTNAALKTTRQPKKPTLFQTDHWTRHTIPFTLM
jgi:hypothetical protein